MVRKILIAVLISVIVIGFFAFLKIITYKDCSVLSVFKSSSLHDLVNIMKMLGIMILIWVLGFFIYFLFLIKRNYNILIYFIILSVIISSFLFKGIYNQIWDDNIAIKGSICAKSSFDGMQCKMKNLTYKEYEFVKSDSWLPEIPSTSINISIDYYRDEFTGDYDLTIRISIPKECKFDLSANPDWTIIEGNNENYKIVEFQKWLN